LSREKLSHAVIVINDDKKSEIPLTDLTKGEYKAKLPLAGLPEEDGPHLAITGLKGGAPIFFSR
jgi:hypothetical protein